MTTFTNCISINGWKCFSAGALAIGSFICAAPVLAGQQSDVIAAPKIQLLAQATFNPNPSRAAGANSGNTGYRNSNSVTGTGTLKPGTDPGPTPSGSVTTGGQNSSGATPPDTYDPSTSPGRLQQNRRGDGVQKVTLLSGVSPPTIATTTIAEATVNFIDANGTPWPAARANNSDPSNWYMSLSSNSLRVQPLRDNLSQLQVTVYLQGSDIPLSLNMSCCGGAPGTVTTLQITNATIPTR